MEVDVPAVVSCILNVLMMISFCLIFVLLYTKTSNKLIKVSFAILAILTLGVTPFTTKAVYKIIHSANIVESSY